MTQGQVADKPPEKRTELRETRGEGSKQRTGKRRTKTKCTFGPNSRLRQREDATLPAPSTEEASSEIDELLREIDLTRWGESSLPQAWEPPPEDDIRRLNTQVGRDNSPTVHTPTPIQHEEHQTETAQELQTWREHTLRRVPKSRPKAKCRFGPYKRGNVPPPRQEADHPQGSLPPAPGPSSTAGRWPAHHSHDTPTPTQGIGPFRTTLTLPTIRKSSPFSRYYPTAPEAPRPRHNRFALKRLGLTEDILEVRVNQEVDDLLREMRAERQLARIMPGPSVDILRPLSKEDCLMLFIATGVPPPGPLWGVWRWAADLDTARYNFDVEVEGDDYSILDTYD